MPSILGILGENLDAAYKAADNQLGGFLPGGVEPDAAGFARNVVKDAVPGRNFTAAEGWAAKGKSTSKDFMGGRVDLAQSKMRTSKATSRAREAVVEEVGERVIKKAGERVAKRAGLYAIPLVGQVAGIYDTVTDAGAFADAVVEVNTGEGVGAHWEKTREMRDRGRSMEALFPETGYVGDGVHTMGQGAEVNPGWQEAKNRATRFKRRFNPLHGDLGVSEAMGWN